MFFQSSLSSAHLKLNYSQQREESLHYIITFSMIGSLPSISMMLLAPALDHLWAVSQTTFWLVAHSLRKHIIRVTLTVAVNKKFMFRFKKRSFYSKPFHEKNVLLRCGNETGTPSRNGMERIPKRKRTYRNCLHVECKNGERERSETDRE